MSSPIKGRVLLLVFEDFYDKRIIIKCTIQVNCAILPLYYPHQLHLFVCLVINPFNNLKYT